MRNKLIGLGLLLAVILAVVVIKTHQASQKPQVTLNGYIGGEKIGVLDDPEIVKILHDKYGLTLDYTKLGSIDMVKGDTSTVDYLWPSSQTALELFKETKSQQLVNSQIIFNSPIVLYSWDIVTDALIRQGIVRQENGSYFVVDMPRLIDLVIQNKKWSDIGVNDLYGNVTIISTDPNQSNSGNMFAGLLANLLNNGAVVDDASVDRALPKIKQVFAQLGYMEPSSADIFSQYLSTGVGAKPIIVGYESQLVEFAIANPAQWQQVKSKVRILYPEPTVWSSHPFMALDGKASGAITALSDPDVQRLAWEKHGFRTGLAGVQNDPKVLNIVGIPDKINKIIPMPKPSVMGKIMQALQ